MCKLIPLRVAHSKPFWVAQLNRCYQRSERLYLSVYSDVIKTEGATPYDAAPSVLEDRVRKDRFFMLRCGFGQVISG